MKNILLLLTMHIFYTTNAQWTQQNSGTSNALYEIFFPATDTGYAVGYYGTVLKTTNGGINWNSLNTGYTLNYNDVFFYSTNEGWVVGDSGSVCHTVDGGNIWNCHFLDSAEYIELYAVYALNSNTVLVGGQKNASTGYIAKTEDGGTSWQQKFVENYIWDVSIKKIGMINDSTGYAITRGNVLKTTDYGNNWLITDTISVHAGAMFRLLEDIAFFPNNDTLYVCGWYDAYFGSTFNAALSWHHNTDYQNYNLDFINTLVGYVGGWCQIQITNNGGNTFTDASGGNSNLFCDIYSIDFTDEWTGYACGANGKILKTINGGATSLQEPTQNFPNIMIYPNPTNNIIHFSDFCNVQICNVNGQIISERKKVKYVDLSNYSTGMYYLVFYTDKEVVIQ